MKTTCTTVSAALFAAFLFAVPATADEPSIPFTGAEIGVWTQDYAAATNAAAADGKPVFLNFTGSDWCGWCMLMENKVFLTQEWEEWAATNLYLVTLDFPRDESKVPDEYKDRNRALKAKYHVRGYPTYVVVDAQGRKLGQLGASRDATPAEFIRQLRGVLESAPPASAPSSDADPAVRHLVAMIAIIQRSTEMAADGFDTPTMGQLAQLVDQHAAELAAIDTNGVPESVLVPFRSFREAFETLSAECKKHDQNKLLSEFDTQPAGIWGALLEIEKTRDALVKAAEACGVEDAADQLSL